jgi:hypothetical protein
MAKKVDEINFHHPRCGRVDAKLTSAFVAEASLILNFFCLTYRERYSIRIKLLKLGLAPFKPVSDN